MIHDVSDDEARIAAIKAELRERGFYVRYTEWPLGHEVVIHLRSDTSRTLVTDWHRSELAAYEAALRLAEEHAFAPRAAAAEAPSPEPPLSGLS